MATPIDLSGMTVTQALAKLRGAFPRATNALALAALEGVPQWSTAAAGVAAGLTTNVAESYLAPDGVLPRMRLIACGWLKAGDSFRHPEDAAWWKQSYRYDLWPQLESYAAAVDNTASHEMTWDADVAAGDVGAISQAMSLTVEELKDVFEAPCPKWLVPPGRGMPTPNPECIRREAEKNKDKIPLPPVPQRGSSSGSGWLLLVIAVAYMLGRKRR
jgi:hypothetical protein